MKTLKNIAAIACVAALAVPAGVAAKGPNGEHGKSGLPHGKSQTKSKRCKHTPRVGFQIKGTVVSYDAATNTFVIDVADNGVSRHAKGFVTSDPLTVTGAKAYDNPQPNDKVVVHGKIDKPKKKCTETDAARSASAKFTRVTKQDTTEQEQQQEQQQTAASAA
ncbi:MAG TPA: hypothetical protein VH247_08145 [Thermoleophilaceae bacterium]|nr:hypothetical protein [Thermoleophilaceae bacterium]